MTTDNKTITIPNGTVASSVIINFSKASKRRVDCTFGIGYGDDISHAKEILVKTAESCPYVLKEEEMVVGVADHGESSVNIDLKVWTLTENYWDTKYFLEEKVKLAFDEAGIDIPYNQLTVHMS
jgi:small conductance mechanosensitive channel